MVADGHVLVVREQWIVGAELASDVHRVMNAGVEVRVVADPRRQPLGLFLQLQLVLTLVVMAGFAYAGAETLGEPIEAEPKSRGPW